MTKHSGQDKRGFAATSLVAVLLLALQACSFHATERLQIAPSKEIEFKWWNKGKLVCFTFEYNSNRYSYETPHTPFIITAEADRAYVVDFDRETNFSKTTFRYFASEKGGKFHEIDRTQFPKHLAVQNWWWVNKGDKERAAARDPKDYWFRNSLTAKVWLHIEQGIPYYQNEVPSEEFVVAYKRAYLDAKDSRTETDKNTHRRLSAFRAIDVSRCTPVTRPLTRLAS